jgi:hypothetical protein
LILIARYSAYVFKVKPELFHLASFLFLAKVSPVYFFWGIWHLAIFWFETKPSLFATKVAPGFVFDEGLAIFIFFFHFFSKKQSLYI